jgi:hypothetical protein
MLEELKKYQLSLWVIGILILMRFIIIPIIEWQNEQLVEIKLLQGQQSRIDNVLANSQQIENLDIELSSILEQSSTLFLTSTDSASFQLERQQWVEDTTKLFNLNIVNVGWSPALTVPDIKLVGHVMLLNTEGNTVDTIRFIQALQAQLNFIEIQTFGFRISQIKDSVLGKSRTKLNLVFYRKVENK